MRVKVSASDNVQWGVMPWRGMYLQGWSLGAGCGDHTAAQIDTVHALQATKGPTSYLAQVTKELSSMNATLFKISS